MTEAVPQAPESTAETSYQRLVSIVMQRLPPELGARFGQVSELCQARYQAGHAAMCDVRDACQSTLQRELAGKETPYLLTGAALIVAALSHFLAGLDTKQLEAITTFGCGALAERKFVKMGHAYAAGRPAEASREGLEAHGLFWLISGVGAAIHQDLRYLIANVSFTPGNVGNYLKHTCGQQTLSNLWNPYTAGVVVGGALAGNAAMGQFDSPESVIAPLGLSLTAWALTLNHTSKAFHFFLALSAALTAAGSAVSFAQSDYTEYMAAFWTGASGWAAWNLKKYLNPSGLWAELRNMPTQVRSDLRTLMSRQPRHPREIP